jgi:hypothetical protein
MGANNMTTYILPINGHTEKVTWLSGLAFALLGPLYFLFRGMIGPAVVWTLLIMFTVGFAWPVGWFLAPGVVAKHLKRSGYRFTDRKMEVTFEP